MRRILALIRLYLSRGEERLERCQSTDDDSHRRLNLTPQVEPGSFWMGVVFVRNDDPNDGENHNHNAKTENTAEGELLCPRQLDPHG